MELSHSINLQKYARVSDRSKVSTFFQGLGEEGQQLKLDLKEKQNKNELQRLKQLLKERNKKLAQLSEEVELKKQHLAEETERFQKEREQFMRENKEILERENEFLQKRELFEAQKNSEREKKIQSLAAIERYR